MHLCWGIVLVSFPSPIKRRELGLCLLYFEQLVKGTRAIKAVAYFSGHYFVRLPWVRGAAVPRSDKHTCLEQGVQWVRRGGLQGALTVQAGSAQTCVEPSGLCESCLSRLLDSPLARTPTLGQGTPSPPCLFRMLHQGKSLLQQLSVQLGDQAHPGALETSPTRRGKW